jgi:predicted ribosomally synthesized peptide with SipW-like signal peptide
MNDTDGTELDSRKTRRRRGIIVLLLSLSIGTLGAGAFSLALFTDSSASSGSFTTGTIVLTTNPATLFTVASMMPGDSGSATLTVQNTGTGQLRYALTSSSTNADAKALRDQISLSVKAGACPGAGAALYNAALSGAAFGDVTAGAQAGDRTLNAATSEQLCFAWSLPLATGNAFQGAATTTTFTFTAEQTANNP